MRSNTLTRVSNNPGAVHGLPRRFCNRTWPMPRVGVTNVVDYPKAPKP